MFLLDSTGSAYDQDVVFKDGPIIYGTEAGSAAKARVIIR